jgi:hypothetical protein
MGMIVGVFDVIVGALNESVTSLLLLFKQLQQWPQSYEIGKVSDLVRIEVVRAIWNSRGVIKAQLGSSSTSLRSWQFLRTCSTKNLALEVVAFCIRLNSKISLAGATENAD